jgi:hypothetical protein
MKADLSRFSWLALLAAAVLVVWCQSHALGQARSSRYSVQHAYSWQPASPNPTLQVFWNHFEHASARDFMLGIMCGVNPVPQKPNFDGYFGTDRLDATGQPWNSGLYGPVPIVEASVILTGVVPPAGGSSTASAIIGNCNATATSAWSISALGAGLSATNMSSGQATLTGPASDRAYAFSESKLIVVEQPQSPNIGMIAWRPRWSDTVSGSATVPGVRNSRGNDPVHVTLFDDAHVVVLEDTPIRIEGELLQGEIDESRLGWEDGHLFAQGVWEGSIVGMVDSPFIDPAQTGEFEIRVHNGVVTTSRHTGVFNTAILPPVGTPGTFDVPFLTEIVINYSYPNLAPNMSISFGGGGGGSTMPPIPGDANGDGKVDATDATTVAAHWGQVGGWSDGDFNSDTLVTAADASLMAANWGYGTSEAGAVPEPSALALLFMGVVGFPFRRRQH